MTFGGMSIQRNAAACSYLSSSNSESDPDSCLGWGSATEKDAGVPRPRCRRSEQAAVEYSNSDQGCSQQQDEYTHYSGQGSLQSEMDYNELTKQGATGQAQKQPAGLGGEGGSGGTMCPALRRRRHKPETATEKTQLAPLEEEPIQGGGRARSVAAATSSGPLCLCRRSRERRDTFFLLLFFLLLPVYYIIT